MKKLIKKSLGILLVLFSVLSCFNGCVNGSTNHDANNDSKEEVNDFPYEIMPNELDADNDLVLALIIFLDNRMMQADKADITIADYIDEVKNGARPLLVDFNTSKCYFVCGYYSSGCEYESLNYCCKDNYTWVRYENAEDIRESYKNKDMMVAFQFNIASLIRNIASNEDLPRFENFNIFETKFVNGLNVNEPVVYDKCWLYIDQSEKNTIYETSYPSSISGYNYKTQCLYLDGEYYLFFCLFDDQSYNDYFYYTVEFKTYYNDMMSILITDKYSVKNNDGSVTEYGLINIRDFTNNIVKGD